MNSQKVKVYSSATIYRIGIGSILKKMTVSVLESRQLIWQFFLKDFKSRYKQSLLGWAWIFLMPVITMGTFLLLNMSGVIKIGDIPVPYPIFGLLGFSLWQVIANGLPVLTSSVAGSRRLVSQINFPKESLIFASCGKILVDFLIRVVLVIVVYLIYGRLPSVYALLFPLFILPVFMLTLGLGFITALLQVIIGDTKSFINVGLNFFLFLMPIMYTLPEKGLLAKVNRYNPVYFLIKSARDIVIQGRIDYWQQFLGSSFFALAVFIFGWFAFYISQDKLAERI